MNELIAKKWVAALRSGDYKQQRYYLKTYSGYCCLGVLCEAVLGMESTINGDIFRFGKNSCMLPISAVQACSMNSCEGATSNSRGLCIDGNYYDHLAGANDSGVSFKKIADYIEANWELL